MPRHALVIDDTRLTANSLAQMLDLLGYQTRVAYGSRATIEEAARQTPDVILLDINMPGIDGVEVCRFFRREPRTASVPIVAMSTETQEEMVARVRQAGANIFLPKPMDFEALEQVLKEFEKTVGKRGGRHVSP